MKPWKLSFDVIKLTKLRNKICKILVMRFAKLKNGICKVDKNEVRHVE